MSFERVQSTPDRSQSEPTTWLQPDSIIPDGPYRQDGLAPILIATQSSYRLIADTEVRPWQVSRSATSTTR